MIVVVPSNRAINLSYLAPLIDHGARFIIVDDTEGTITVPHRAFQVINWQDRRHILGPHDDHFPRKNGASRAVGFCVAWRESDQDEIIVALDDDCEIESPTFGREVEAALSAWPRPILGGQGEHANILDLYEDIPANLFPRGFPYEARAEYLPRPLSSELDPRAPQFNLGLWRDAFDVNAIDKIHGPEWRHPDARLKSSQVAVPAGALISVCSMNMQFRRAVLPAAFQFPMHVPAMPHWVFDRYGDIWGGFLLKRLMDVAGDLLTFGAPMIGHRKAGDLLRNAWQEHLCHIVNRECIDLLSVACETIKPASYLDMMAQVRESLGPLSDRSSPMLRSYLTHLRLGIDHWVKALGQMND